MENAPANEEAPSAKGGINYEEKIAQQEAAVKELADQHAKSPSAELKAQLDQKTDTLLHLKNLAKGDPKQRAKDAAETAKLSVLSKAITQPLA